MNYQPRPIETTGVVLPPAIFELTEKLAENAHDRWSQQRLGEGWTQGERRDDRLKTHPGLVPYAELPESEKQVDRNTAMETLKAIIALGYEIRKSKADQRGTGPI